MNTYSCVSTAVPDNVLRVSPQREPLSEIRTDQSIVNSAQHHPCKIAHAKTAETEAPTATPEPRALLCSS